MDLNRYGIIAEAQTTDCTIEIYLNGIPLALCGVGARQRISLPVHEYLIDGKNELAVLVNPGDTPAAALQFSQESKPAWGAQPPPDPALDAFLGVGEDDGEKQEKPPGWRAPKPGEQREWTKADISHDVEGVAATPSAEFVARLSRYPVGAMAGDPRGVPMAGIRWVARDNFGALREQKQPFPFWLRKEAFLGPMFGRLHWEDGDRLQLDEQTVKDAKELILKVQDMIERGRADDVINLSVRKFKEVARSYGLSATERANLFRRALTEQSAKETWIFETPEDDDFSLRLCAGDRMIECVARDWKPLLRSVEGENGRFLYPMFVGKLQGQWVIMR